MFKYLKSADEIVEKLSSEDLEITMMKSTYLFNLKYEYRLPDWDEIQTYGLPVVFYDKKRCHRDFAVVENDFDAGKLTEILRKNMLKDERWAEVYFDELVERSAKQTREKYNKFLEEEAE